ncbi:hypothetical protein AOY57_11460 [Escherichia coli]|uniref:zonular occludens toxin domain-containing protein n=1 Tax=Escherichia coli TaxID=562 RepID=UPI0019182A7B|nr:zonular occludens toxin domain-containing protein [Escherichia coli]UMT22814.1 hypothetical protein AOY57_11460 [Escherichia coli]CAD6140049.1 Zonula occludens toxin [Escherichia coli]
MPVITGNLGQGKGIVAAYFASLYYRRGLRVAANYPLNTEHMYSGSDNPVTVIPAMPRIEDLEHLGRGCPENEKTRFGALFLDECATWLNTRGFARKDRLPLIDWLIHSRKLGWDVYLIAQHEDMIDSQIIKAMGAKIIRCRRLDELRVPVITPLMELFRPGKTGVASGKRGIIPHYVTASTFLYDGTAHAARRPVDKVVIKAADYYNVYDTNFIFSDGMELLNGRFVDMRAIYSVLPGRTLMTMNQLPEQSGKKATPQKKPWGKLIAFLFLVAVMVAIARHYFSGGQDVHAAASPVPENTATPSHPSPASTVAPEQRQKKPDVLPVSKEWRLAGYVRGVMPYFVLLGPSGQVRRYTSVQPWNGSATELNVDGERVTFWSGSSATVSKGDALTDKMLSFDVKSK